MEELECWTDKSMNTMYKGLMRLYKEMPNHPLLGTKVFGENEKGEMKPMYRWMKVKDAIDQCKYFAAGCMKLGLLPTVQSEGKEWRFLGIQAKNRAEWVIAHWGNMWNGTTTVALYETLGQPAMKYIINQTEMITIACTADIVKKICEMKIEDDQLPANERKMHRLQYIISLNGEPSEED